MSKQLAGRNVMFNYVTLEALILINLHVEASVYYGMQLKKKRGEKVLDSKQMKLSIKERQILFSKLPVH